MSDKLFELPRLTYSEREDVLMCILMRMQSDQADSDELYRIEAVYQKIQSHF